MDVETEEEQICAICFDHVSQEEAANLPCKPIHPLHYKCAFDWLREAYREHKIFCCPQCRKDQINLIKDKEENGEEQPDPDFRDDRFEQFREELQIFRQNLRIQRREQGDLFENMLQRDRNPPPRDVDKENHIVANDIFAICVTIGLFGAIFVSKLFL